MSVWLSLGVMLAITGTVMALVDSDLNWHWAKGLVLGFATGVVANLLYECLGLYKTKPWWKRF